jgi:hypothetical protein
MLSTSGMKRIQAEAHASVLEAEITTEPFAAGPMIRELRVLIRVLPDLDRQLKLGFRQCPITQDSVE